MSFSRLLVAACLVAVAGLTSPARAANEPDQITDDDGTTGCESVSPVLSAAGDSGAWQSDCNPTGANADGSLEIFRGQEGLDDVQVTSGTNCSSDHASISSDGTRVAFTSTCNLTGENADGNVEIFLWKSGGAGTITQLTHSQGCDNYEPAISGPGAFIAFDSTCNLAGFNNGGRGSEIFRVSAAGVLKQMTNDPNGGSCDSGAPSINDAGTLIAFDSDCNLTGENEALDTQVYTVTGQGVDGGTVVQRTQTDNEDCSSLRPSIDAAGMVMAWLSDCDPLGQNSDRSDEIFTMPLTGMPEIRQVSVGDDDLCASGEPRVSANGRAVVFTSFCKLESQNGDGSIEVFHAGLGLSESGIFAVTQGSSCSSVGGGPSADGTLVGFDSDCDPTGENDDGSVEVFRASTCTCGAPQTRDTDPKASDALFVLRSAVGASVCVLCQCDVDNNGSIGALDALRTLKAAVGQPVPLNCRPA